MRVQDAHSEYIQIHASLSTNLRGNRHGYVAVVIGETETGGRKITSSRGNGTQHPHIQAAHAPFSPAITDAPQPSFQLLKVPTQPCQPTHPTHLPAASCPHLPHCQVTRTNLHCLRSIAQTQISSYAVAIIRTVLRPLMLLSTHNSICTPDPSVSALASTHQRLPSADHDFGRRLPNRIGYWPPTMIWPPTAKHD